MICRLRLPSSRIRACVEGFWALSPTHPQTHTHTYGTHLGVAQRLSPQAGAALGGVVRSPTSYTVQHYGCAGTAWDRPLHADASRHGQQHGTIVTCLSTLTNCPCPHQLCVDHQTRGRLCVSHASWVPECCWEHLAACCTEQPAASVVCHILASDG